MRYMKHSIIGIALLAAIPAAAWSAPLSVEVTSDRGPDAVYQDDEVIDLSVRVSEDAHVLVYEIEKGCAASFFGEECVIADVIRLTCFGV